MMDSIVVKVARALAKEAYNTEPPSGLSIADVCAFVEDEWPEYVREAEVAISVIYDAIRADSGAFDRRVKNERAVILAAQEFCNRQISINPSNAGLMTAVRRLNTGAK